MLLLIGNVALGIVAKILFFLEKIEAKSPPLSSLRKGNAPINLNILLFKAENIPHSPQYYKINPQTGHLVS
jgi:hypothetical protein